MSKKEKSGWIPASKLPSKSMKVHWLCSDNTTDVGFYNHEKAAFITWDARSSSEITHWKPFEVNFLF